MQTKIAGITFRIAENPEIANLRPKGEVFLWHDENNKFDQLAVSVQYLEDGDGFDIGYLPAKSSAQKAFHEGKIKSAKIASYSCQMTDEHGIVSWNDQGAGALGSVTLDLEVSEEQAPEDSEKQIGEKYERITSFLKRNSHLYESDEDRARLDDWNRRNEDGMANAARLGTVIHRLIEEQAIAGIGTAKRIMDKHGIRLLATEQKVFNEELELEGTFDALFESWLSPRMRIVVDWKSSKSPRESHKLQAVFYALSEGADWAWVICLGAENKQGYSVCKIEGLLFEKYSAKLKEMVAEARKRDAAQSATS